MIDHFSTHSLAMHAAGRPSHPAASSRKKHGFTLVEILVVIVIIAVLSTLGMFTYQGVMTSAQRAKCASNMRQLGIGLISYAQDHNGRLPATQHHRTYGSEDSWVFLLKDYFGDELEEIRICPADPLGRERARNNASSYVLNSFLDSGAPGASYGNINAIRHPSRTMMLFIISDRKGAGTGNDHIHGAGWRNWARVLSDIQPDRFLRGNPNATHTKGSANYLYADGRVETIEAAEIKRRIDSGINIARPPQ